MIGLIEVIVLTFCVSFSVGETVRAVAVGHRQNVTLSSSYDTFADQFIKREDLFDARYGNEGNLLPSVVVFGEYTGLTAAFIGSRGSEGRSAPSIISAFESLMAAYAPQMHIYRSKYPSISLVNALSLALTDVMSRAMIHTFSSLAIKYDAYVAVGAMLPYIYESTNPDDIATFGDPDMPHQHSVYLPLSSNVYNMALLFAPNGTLLGNTTKTHLNTMETELLDLTPTTVENNLVFHTDIGTLCIAICFDGDHSDIISWLDSQGCDVLLHPSYNDMTWPTNVTSESHAWQPLDWYTGPLGSMALSQHINHVINAMVTGNLFELTVDGQSSITERSNERPIQEYLSVGVSPVDLTVPPYNFTGTILAHAPWVFPDPVHLPQAERRQILHNLAMTLAPGSNSPMEGMYVDAVISADISVA